MADLKITQLPAQTSATDDDLLVIVNDPAGSPVTDKITVGDFKASLLYPRVVRTTTFETTAHYSYSADGGATRALDLDGVNIQCGGAGGSSNMNWSLGVGNTFGWLRSPVFSTAFRFITLDATNAQIFCGIGAVTVAQVAGHTWTNRHIGFKLVRSGGTTSLYATQADNTTENASSALTTVVAGDFLELMLKINGTTSVDYYWVKNNGAWSAATNLTSNMPTTTTDTNVIQWSTRGDDDECRIKIPTGHYER